MIPYLKNYLPNKAFRIQVSIVFSKIAKDSCGLGLRMGSIDMMVRNLKSIGMTLMTIIVSAIMKYGPFKRIAGGIYG